MEKGAVIFKVAIGDNVPVPFVALLLSARHPAWLPSEQAPAFLRRCLLQFPGGCQLSVPQGDLLAGPTHQRLPRLWQNGRVRQERPDFGRSWDGDNKER